VTVVPATAVAVVAAVLASACGPRPTAMARVLATSSSRDLRRRRRVGSEEYLDPALLLELMAASLAAGSTPAGLVADLLEAVPDGTARFLRPVAAALALGAAPDQAYAPLLDDPRLRPLAVALGRAGAAGTSAADVLRAAADDLRDERRSAAAAAAHRAGVRAVVPLAVCFLPAFVLLGVVPTLVGAAASLLGGT
jgi:pilus assembly protein TadC